MIPAQRTAKREEIKNLIVDTIGYFDSYTNIIRTTPAPLPWALMGECRSYLRLFEEGDQTTPEAFKESA